MVETTAGRNRRESLWRHIFKAVTAISLVIMALALAGCSFEDIDGFVGEKVLSDQEDIYSLATDPEGEGREAVGKAGETTKRYYDEVTGLEVSRAQYYAYHVTDAVKTYGLYIVIPSFVLGFAVRRLVHGSASVRKLGLFLELWVPFLYWVLTFVLSALADGVT